MAATNDAVSAQLLKAAQVQNTLLGAQLAQSAAARQRASHRTAVILFSVLFFLLSRYVVLRQQYAPVFTMWKDYKNVFPCALENSTPWHIALSISYPWLAQLILQNPIKQATARFLWYIIYTNSLPTQQWIDSKFPNYGITPLDYFCGNVAGKWLASHSDPVNDAVAFLTSTSSSQGVANSPWATILTQNAQLLTDANMLRQFLLGGFYGAAQFAESSSTSANDLYQIFYGQQPPSTCSGGNRALSIASSAATGMMALSVLGTPAAIIGGLGMGLLSFFGGSSSC